MVQAVRGASSKGYGYYEGSFMRDGSFKGCLVDAGGLPPHLVDSIWESLFNCGSVYASEARQRLDMSVHLNDRDRDFVAATGHVSPNGLAWDREGGDLQALAACHGVTCEMDDFWGWARWCDGWSGYQIDCTTTAVSGVIEEWDTEQQLMWPSSWKLEALATCHEVVCEDSYGSVSERHCTVAQTDSDA